MDPWRFTAGDRACFRHFEHAGFAVVERVLSPSLTARLTAVVTGSVGPEGYAKRNLLTALPPVRQLAESTELRALVEPVLGSSAFPVKGTLFDKTVSANWKVAWHQDTMICVRKRIDTPGFGPWSAKAGVVHVQPPSEVLADMMTVRVHLDACGPDNGPLRVIPGSHLQGVIGTEAIDARREAHPEVTCCVPEGGVLLMRPLLLHASSAAEAPSHRRVIHLEFASSTLPNGLHWANC
jgi:hypothetical protein